jgi:acetoin utilization protein AcuB
MRVQDVMTRRVETVSAGESAGNAFQRMRSNRIHHLIVTQGREVLGVVSSRDLGALGTFRQVQSVEDVMTSPAVTATPEMTLRQAANLLRGRTIGCLPVMEEGRLVGILTITDLLETLGRGVDRPTAKGKRWVMKGRGPRRKSVIGHKNVVAR